MTETHLNWTVQVRSGGGLWAWVAKQWTGWEQSQGERVSFFPQCLSLASTPIKLFYVGWSCLSGNGSQLTSWPPREKSYVFLASPSGRVQLYLQLQVEVSGAGGWLVWLSSTSPPWTSHCGHDGEVCDWLGFHHMTVLGPLTCGMKGVYFPQTREYLTDRSSRFLLQWKKKILAYFLAQKQVLR